MLCGVTGRKVACIIFITQSDKGGRGLARDPGPHSWPSWPPVPSAPPAPTPATTPEYVRHFGGPPAPPALRAAHLTLETIVVHQLNEYRNMMVSLYIHCLKHYLSNDTKIKQKYEVLKRARRKKSPPPLPGNLNCHLRDIDNCHDNCHDN